MNPRQLQFSGFLYFLPISPLLFLNILKQSLQVLHINSKVACIFLYPFR